MLNAGITASDDETRIVGKRLFNADCILGMIMPWVGTLGLAVIGTGHFVLILINTVLTLVFGACLLLQWRQRPIASLTVFITTIFVLLELSVFLMTAKLALPVLLAISILAMVSLLQDRVRTIYLVSSGMVALGIASIVLASVYPLPQPEWAQILVRYEVMDVLLGLIFLYKSFMFIFLYARNYKRFEVKAALAEEHAERYHNLFDNTLEAILVLDESNGRILDANRSALEMFGYTTEEFCTLQVDQLFVEPYAHHSQLKDQMQTMARNQDGAGFYVEFSHFPISEEDENITVLSIRNIHDRVLSDLQRIQNQIRYQRIFDTNALGIQETDMSILYRDLTLLKAKGVEDLGAYINEHPERLQEWLATTRITDVNTALLNLIGAPNKDYLLQNLPEFLTEQAFEAFVKETMAIWNNETHFTGEIEIRKASGDIRVLQYTTNFPTDGNFEHLVYTYVDITDIRRQQSTIEEQVALLNEKNTILQKYIESNMQLENFAYVASHDLQTPLRAIMGFTQILQDELRERMTPEEAAYFGHIVKATGNMNQLIEDLLLFSRVNSHKTNWAEINPEALVQELLLELRPQIEEHQALVQMHDLPERLAGDHTRLRQLFQNLLTNALKFRSEEASPLIQIKCVREERFWHFTVSDNGIGIAPEFQDRIFLLFQKLHSPDDYRGTGIGLSLCKTIVEQHGGQLWIDSQEGKGSTFHFTLSVEPQLLDPPSEQVASAPSLTASVH